MTTPEPPVAQRDFAVLIQGAALPLLYRAVLTLAARHHRDGLASPPLLHEIRTALYRVMSAPGREIASAAPTKPCCTCQSASDLISTTEAATLLSISPRQVTRLAAQDDAVLGGFRLGNAWVLRRTPVLALAARRKASR